MTEEELAPGRSSVAVNNCIRQLSYHKNNLHDPMSGGWGEVSWQGGGVAAKCRNWESWENQAALLPGLGRWVQTHQASLQDGSVTPDQEMVA